MQPFKFICQICEPVLTCDRRGSASITPFDVNLCSCSQQNLHNLLMSLLCRINESSTSPRILHIHVHASTEHCLNRPHESPMRCQP